MCLKLNKNARKRTANKDIVVYKRIVLGQIVTCDLINDGDEFNGYILTTPCSGKIHKTKDGELYFCTNEPTLNGSESPNKFDYLYSWVYDSDVKSIIINGVELIKNLKKEDILKTPYRDFIIKIGDKIESDLVCEDGYVNVGLHSFGSYISARRDGLGLIVKCVIPKGSKYYKGFYGLEVSYASDKLNYLDIISR